MLAQMTWGWYIVLYLFLAGVGAGAYLVGVLSEFYRLKSKLASKIGVVLGAPLVLVGTLFLFLDLGQPSSFIYVFSNPSSMITIGSIIISVFMIIGAVHIGFWIWPFKLLEKAESARRALGLLGVAFALGTAVYTGVLLGVLAAVPFWNSSLLPILFLVSAASTGLSSVIFGLVTLQKRRIGVELSSLNDSIKSLAKADGVLLAVELFVLLMYLSLAPGSSPAVAASIQLILTGYLSMFFWIGLVAAGLVLPFVLDIVAHRARGVVPYMLASVLVLAGGLILRYVVVAAGVPVAYQAAFGTQPFFVIPAWVPGSGTELTSLVPGTFDYFLVGAFFAALLLVYAGSRLFVPRSKPVGGN